MAPSVLAALFGLLAGAVEGVRLSHEARGPQLRVAVEELLPLLQSQRSLPSLRSLGFSMQSIYGAPVCGGAPGFVAREDAPPQFCRYAGRDWSRRALPRQYHPDWVFDNYAMERIMLGKWLSSSALCRVGETPDNCGPSGPNVVVLPSPSLHYFVKGGFSWPTFYTQSIDVHRRYWVAIRERYGGSQGSPLLVVHHPFAFHCNASLFILKALAEQPTDFVGRVVIAALEGNLFHMHRTIFPGAGVNDPEVALAQHRGKTPPQGRGAPLVVSMPYPTSILEAVRFADGGSAGAYRPDRRRPIAVSFQASRKPGAWMREELVQQMQGRSMVCASEKIVGCGLSKTSLWDIAANSAFCMEPPGDTLTRASLYIAVLSGCIPVVFDFGHSSYDASERTQWAWRSLEAEAGPAHRRLEPFLDYREFAVVLNSSDIHDKKINVVKMLTDMPQEDPQRFAALRAGLDRAAPLMRYARSSCEGGRCVDAFTAFQSVLVRALASQGPA